MIIVFITKKILLRLDPYVCKFVNTKNLSCSVGYVSLTNEFVYGLFVRMRFIHGQTHIILSFYTLPHASCFACVVDVWAFASRILIKWSYKCFDQISISFVWLLLIFAHSLPRSQANTFMLQQPIKQRLFAHTTIKQQLLHVQCKTFAHTFFYHPSE